MGIPKSGTNIVLHMQQGLEIKSISLLYEESHVTNHVDMRIKGDSTVQAALSNAFDCESNLVRTSSTIVRCENLFINATQLKEAQHILTPVHTDVINVNNAVNTHSIQNDLKKHVKNVVRADITQSQVQKMQEHCKQ